MMAGRKDTITEGAGGTLRQVKLKLAIHQKTYSREEVLLNLQDVGAAEGNILEIFHPENSRFASRPGGPLPHLLLQVPHSISKDDSVVTKGNISVEQTIASQFGLQSYQTVTVKKIQPEDVALQLLELTFKDQYLNRSDMWRFTQSLVGTVVYKNKMVEFCNQTVRCQVFDMWCQGSRVACGYVSDHTKVVYRSSTSRFYLFIQMSSEMWEFDHYGDLYFEKAVSGFLTDLFERWKQLNTNHEVTIVLFSRSFYPTATNIEEFPADMRHCIQKDPLGRYFQDFYRVAVQNERHDDWSCVLRTLRQLFYHYPRAVLGRENIDGHTLPDVRRTHAARENVDGHTLPDVRQTHSARENVGDHTLPDERRTNVARAATRAKVKDNLFTSGYTNSLEDALNCAGDCALSSPSKTSENDPSEKKTATGIKFDSTSMPPRAELSTADQGNFLEVLNMSLNVFEKHYQDRSLERTGQMSVVVTPGVGVFHVDGPLTSITKQRIVDNGVGSDLVCLGEQPLHAVPLFKFFSKGDGQMEGDYSMPGSWINLSFYSSRKRNSRATRGIQYVPRIKVPENCIPSFYPADKQPNKGNPIDRNGLPTSLGQKVSKLLNPLQSVPHARSPGSIAVDLASGAELLKLKWGLPRTHGAPSPTAGGPEGGAPTTHIPGTAPGSGGLANARASKDQQETSPPSLGDIDAEMDAYDDAVFKLHTNRYFGFEHRGPRTSNLGGSRQKSSLSFSEQRLSTTSQPVTRQLSDPEIRRPDMYVLGDDSDSCAAPSFAPPSSRVPNIELSAFSALTEEHPAQSNVGSTVEEVCDSPRAGRSGQQLRINPFDPKHTTIKITSYRRRWVHIFPKNPSGALIQQHHREGKALQKDQLPMSSSEDDIAALEDLLEEELVQKREENKIPGGQGSGEVEGSTSRPHNIVGAPPGAHKQRGAGVVLSSSADPDTLLWGATGEQEWSAAITTGVDWKSLTLPACLPITTDFFPSEESIDRDYVVSNYSLLPDDVNTILRSGSSFGRGPMTTVQVFNELVSQRLSQGFQLILPKEDDGRHHRGRRQRRKKKSSTPTGPPPLPGAAGAPNTDISAASSTVDLRAAAAGRSSVGRPFSLGGSRPPDPRLRDPAPFPGAKSTPDQGHNTEHRLSIGTIFHKLKLFPDNRIEVSVYRPRSVPETVKKDYSYRFCAPYMSSYELSTTKFKTERLDSYKWNRLDHYVSLYSDSYENPITEDMKYWRMRLVVVPDMHRQVMRYLMERWRETPDTSIYTPLTPDQQATVIEGFLKFLEILHRIKRPVVSKKGRASTAAGGSGPSGSAGGRERSGSTNRIMEEREGRAPSLVTSQSRARLTSDIGEDCQATQHRCSDDKKPGLLTIASPLTDIVAAMRNSGTGLNFFSPRHPGLPLYSFLSADAVQWLKDHVHGANTHEEAMAMMQQLCLERLIRHASGNARMPVYYGFFIYFLVTSIPEHDATGNPETFSQEFHEVEIKPVDYSPSFSSWAPTQVPYGADERTNRKDSPSNHSRSCLPGFLQPHLPPLQQPFKSSAGLLLGPVCIDQNNKSERSEWGELVCSASYSTDAAYFFCLRWMCATGALVTELISMWQRRATACNLFLFPIPSDPFALPRSLDCDPLRGPLHLPLVMSCNPPCEKEPAATSSPQPANISSDSSTSGLYSGLSAGQEFEPDASVSLCTKDSKTEPFENLLTPEVPGIPWASRSGLEVPRPTILRSPTTPRNSSKLCMKHDIFAKFPQETRPQRTRLFQEAILARFGFVRFLNELSATGSGAGGNDPNQFVHMTGNVFVMVLTPGVADSFPAQHYQCHQYPAAGMTGVPTFGGPPAPHPHRTSHHGSRHDIFHPSPRPTSLWPEDGEGRANASGRLSGGAVASPHEEYFHRLMADHHSRQRSAAQQSPGFLWSFNYMLTRRWKSVTSGEEAFAELLLHDFKNFCANKNDRLRKFCESYVCEEEQERSDSKAAANTTPTATADCDDTLAVDEHDMKEGQTAATDGTS